MDMKDVTRKISVGMVGFAFLLSFSALTAQDTPPQPSAGSRNLKVLPVQEIAPGVFRLGEIQIHKKAQSVTFPAQVNMDKGHLEYLLVQSGGKAHESLLRTEIDPYYLSIAFPLLGFEGSDSPLAPQGAPDTAKGEAVKITIVYREGNKNRKVPVDAWVVKKIGEQEESPSMSWIYTGSKVLDGALLAQVQGSIAAIHHDPAALIDNATPGGEGDEIWFVKEGVVPPAGTPVTVVIRGNK
jgi:hypothetical protein